MKLADGDVLDDALELFHNHQWREHKPSISVEQMAELIPVLAPLWQEARSKARAGRPKQKVQNRATPKVDKGSEHLGRRLVSARSDDLCEVEVEDVCTSRGQEWQHRKNRSQRGTWHASNGLRACSPCHRWIHANPHEALQNGWTVPSFAVPAERPVLRRGEWVLLDDEGGITPANLGGAA